MRKLNVSTLAVPIFLLGICTTFQNCDAGFQYDPQSGELASLGTNDLTGVFGVVAYAAGGTSPLSQSTSFDTGFDYEIRATGATTSTALLSFSINSTSTTATCTLNSVGNMLKRSVKCTTAGVVRVDLKAVWPDSTISQVSLTKNVQAFSAVPTPPPTNNGNVVQFRIRAGTGGSPWNTSAAPIQVFVGQTLQVFNDDNVPHRIHTGGSPFAHQANDTAPNSSTNFAIVSAHSATATDTYDHDAGTSANVFIESIDGGERYGFANGPGSCASCHGGLATSDKRGASFTSIKNAIAGNKGNMRGITLTDQELRAIAYILNK